MHILSYITTLQYLNKHVFVSKYAILAVNVGPIPVSKLSASMFTGILSQSTTHRCICAP